MAVQRAGPRPGALRAKHQTPAAPSGTRTRNGSVLSGSGFRAISSSTTVQSAHHHSPHSNHARFDAKAPTRHADHPATLHRSQQHPHQEEHAHFKIKPVITAGLGKTYAVEQALARRRGQVSLCWVAFPSRPTMRLVAAALFAELTGDPGRAAQPVRALRGVGRRRPHAAGPAAGAGCGRRGPAAQHRMHRVPALPARPPDTRFALLLVGGDGTWKVLSREPMLRSRIYRRVALEPLTGRQVCGLMPPYHPIYDRDPELLLLVDDHFAHGNLRDWAAFTHTATALCPGTATTGSTRRSPATRSPCTAAASGCDRRAPAVIGPASRAATGTGAAITGRWPVAVADRGHMAVGGRARWVLDPTDDLACVRALTVAARPRAGRVVCHTSPSASWPVLVRDLLTAWASPRCPRPRPTRRGRPDVVGCVAAGRGCPGHGRAARAPALARRGARAVVELAAAAGTTDGSSGTTRAATAGGGHPRNARRVADRGRDPSPPQIPTDAGRRRGRRGLWPDPESARAWTPEPGQPDPRLSNPVSFTRARRSVWRYSA